MYLSGDQAEKDVLRQGDVVSGIHILGAISLEAISYLEKDDAKIGWCVQAKPVFGPVVVLSDSCEIDPGNDVKVTSIILAPARDVSKTTGQGKIDELRASNLIGPNTEYSYLKYFYLEPLVLLEFSQGAVVDFSKAFSVRKTSYARLVARKIIQMDPHFADAMALKLALYFFRREHPAPAP